MGHHSSNLQSPKQRNLIRIVAYIVAAFFILAFVAGCYNSWWISSHCTTVLGTLVC